MSVMVISDEQLSYLVSGAIALKLITRDEALNTAKALHSVNVDEYNERYTNQHLEVCPIKIKLISGVDKKQLSVFASCFLYNVSSSFGSTPLGRMVKKLEAHGIKLHGGSIITTEDYLWSI